MIDKFIVYDAKALGKKISNKRKQEHLKQEDLAIKIGCSVAKLGRIEQGKLACSLNTLCKISSILKVDIALLLDGIYTDNSCYLDEVITDKIHNLPPYGKRIAYSLLNVILETDYEG